jgi:hypothetical protein
LEDHGELDQKFTVEYFGINQEQVNKDEWEFWGGEKRGFFGPMVSMDQLRAEESPDIHHTQGSLGYDRIMTHQPAPKAGLQTWVGRKFQQTLAKLEQSVDAIYISLSIEALEVIFFSLKF